MLPEAPTFMTSPMDAATCSIPPLYPTLSLPSDNYDIYIYPAGFSNSIPSVWDLVHFVFVSIPIKIPLSLYRLTLYFVKLTLPIKTIAILLLIFLRYGIYYIRVYWLHSTYQKQLPTWALEPKAVPRMDSGYDLHPDLAHPFCVNSAEGMIAQIEAECGSSCSGGFPNKVLGMFMKSIKIFGYLEEPVFHELSRQLQIRRLLADEVMLDSGRDHNFYVVIEGHVQVYLKPQGCAHRAPGSPPPSHASGLSTSPASASPLSALSPSPSPLPSLPAPSPPLSSPPQMGRSPPPCFPDDLLDDLDSAEIDLRNEYILLNDVHPGGMLSSLFSILYLFTEKIPLRAPPSAPPSPSPDGRGPAGRAATAAAAPGDSRPTGEGRNPYPDIVARAAVDTTLVMIPADAFHRVTRLYPQAAAHIVQVILTRLLRVTFATLHDYLRLPAELLRVERAVYRTSHRELPESLHAGGVLGRVMQYCRLAGDSMPGPPSSPPATAVAATAAYAEGGMVLLAPDILAGLGAAAPGSSSDGADSSGPAAAPAPEPPATPQPPPPPPPPINTTGLGLGLGGTHPRKRGVAHHRRSGSDTTSHAALVPDEQALASLRTEVFECLCSALGLARTGADAVGPPAGSLPPSPSSHGDGQPPGPLHPHHHHHRHHYHYSHRGPYRPDLAADGGAGEPLLPFLSSSTIEAASHYRHAHRHAQRPPSASTASEASHGAGPFVLMPGDVELYFVRRGTVLVEEGQRPEGLYFVVDGLLDVTARRWDSQGRGPGAGTDDDSGGGGMPLAAMTKRMGELAKQASDELHARGRGSGGKQGGPRAATTAAARVHAPAQRRSAPQPGSAGLGPRTPPGPAGRPRSLFVVRPGGLAGYLPAVTDLEAHVQVAALTDGVVAFVPRATLDRMVDHYPIVLLTLAKRLTHAMSPLAMNVDYALEWMQVRSSQVVYRRGDSNDAVHVVLSGRLRAIRQRADGQLGMIAEYGQSQAVGESGLLFDHPRTFTLHAIRDSELVRIPKTLFGALASKYPALTFHIARVVTAQGAVARQWRGQQHEHGGHETAGALDEDPLAASPLPLPLSGSGFGPAADSALPLAAGPGGYNANLKTVGIVPVHADVPVGEFARRLKQALAGQGADAVLLNSTTMSTVFGPRVFAKVGKLRIQNWLAGLEKRHRLILYVADDNVASGWTQHCIRHADCILLVGIGLGDTSIGEYERLMLGMKTTARKELVLLHPERQCPPGTTRSWLQHRIWIQAYHHVQMPLWAARGDGDGNGDGDGDGDGAAEGYVGNRGHRPQHQHQRQHYYYYYHHQHHGSRPRRILRLLTRDIRTRMHASLNALLPHVFSPAARGLAVLRSRLRSSSGYASQVMPVGGGASQPTPSLFRGNRSDFARLARRLCNRSIGVTMSGGGARGIALIGILRAFEEAGIPVDMVGGTSIGAFVSGLYSCSAADTVSLYGRAKSFSKDMSALWRMAIDVTWPWLAYTSGNEFNRAIWKIFKDIQIEDLWLPFFCVSTNITRSKAEVHTAGFAWKYIRASMSLSSIVPPLCDTNGEMLMDGAYLDNLPVGIMQRMMRPEMVFALDIAGEDDTSLVHYGSAVSGLRVLLNHLNPFRRYKIPTLSDVQSRLSFCASSAQLEWVKKANACVYLKVPPGNTSVADFGRFDELYEKGYRYGRAWVKKWEEEGLLDRLFNIDSIMVNQCKPYSRCKRHMRGNSV